MSGQEQSAASLRALDALLPPRVRPPAHPPARRTAGPTSQGTDTRAPHALEGSTSPARAPAPPGRGPPPPRSATGEAGSRARAPQGPLDPDQLNYGYENRSVSPRIFNPSLSCGRALATRDHISKESCGGPVYTCARLLCSAIEGKGMRHWSPATINVNVRIKDQLAS
ncbi:hypothetical protein R6Z07F_012177 [Ovis aries]